MLKFILFCTIIGLTNSLVAVYLPKLSLNLYHLLLFYTILNLCIGTIFYRIVKK
jgi:hypothetical protein